MKLSLSASQVILVLALLPAVTLSMRKSPSKTAKAAAEISFESKSAKYTKTQAETRKSWLMRKDKTIFLIQEIDRARLCMTCSMRNCTLCPTKCVTKQTRFFRSVLHLPTSSSTERKILFGHQHPGNRFSKGTGKSQLKLVPLDWNGRKNTRQKERQTSRPKLVNHDWRRRESTT